MTTLTLTEEFRAALDHLHAGHHLFLTGRAGTGKSTLIRHFLDTTDRSALTVAPTGIAALNVDGYTIHRLFSFPLGADASFVRSPRYRPGRFASVVAELDILIVDEASMVRADLFDALTAALERFGPRPGTPLGGVQLVLVGDLYQLPPVVTDAEAAHVEQRYGTPFFFSADSFDLGRFAMVELGTVFRQAGDTAMVDLLNAVREGSLLEDARTVLNARTDREFEPPLDEFWLTLATTNRIVTARNRQRLDRLPGPVYEIPARITGDTSGFEHPTEDVLRIAVGAQVMMLSNDPLDRWVNGSLGRVAAVGPDPEAPGEMLAEVVLRDGPAVTVRPHTWDVTRPEVQGGRLVHEMVGTFTQLPMKLAWAITIHKSQGQTLDRVIVDLTGGTFANGQLYVALSRCTSLEGLVLKRDVLPRDLKTDIRVRRFLAGSAAAAPEAPIGEVYLAALMVGNRGDRYRPRPVEIALVTDDGDEATTVVNPTQDLFSARTDFALTTRDVQLAPVLTEAWPALGPLLAGRIPVGVRIDEQLDLVDFELKRQGLVLSMPLGVELPADRLTPAERTALAAPTARARARAVRAASHRLRADGRWTASAGTPFAAMPTGHGYLLARTSGDEGTTAPTGFVVGGNISGEDDAAELLAAALRTAFERVTDRDGPVVERLRGLEEHLEVAILPVGFETAAETDLRELLAPGTRICFTGAVVSPVHGALGRDRMERLAEQHGLLPVPSVTKTRTDVLVVAERGSQSSKAKKAADWGKPVIAAEDFLAWTSGKP